MSNNQIEAFAKALRDIQKELNQKIPSEAVLISRSDPEKGEIPERVCGLEVIYCATEPFYTLGRCSWELTRAFENALRRE